MIAPASLYRRSRRRWKKPLAPAHPKTWSQRRVRRHWEIKWQWRLRFIGEALIGHRVALKPVTPDQADVYLPTCF